MHIKAQNGFFLPIQPRSDGEELATGNTCAHQTETFFLSFLVLIFALSPNFRCTFGSFGLLFCHLPLRTLFSTRVSLCCCLHHIKTCGFVSLLYFSFSFLPIVSFPFPSSFICCALLLSLSINLNLPLATALPVLYPTPSVSPHPFSCIFE